MLTIRSLIKAFSFLTMCFFRLWCIKDAEIMVPLIYLSNFWRTVEMPLINFEISLQLKWSKNCILVAGTAANQNPEFKITD